MVPKNVVKAGGKRAVGRTPGQYGGQRELGTYGRRGRDASVIPLEGRGSGRP